MYSVMKNSPKADPAFDQFVARIPPEIATTFTDAQINSIKRVLSSTSIGDGHPVNIRLSLPVPGRRFYFVILAGLERRSYKRIRAERLKHRVWMPANMIVITVFLILLLTCLFSVLYGAQNMSPLPLIQRTWFSPVPSSRHPVSIPWISNQDQCENSGRKWRDGECLDFEHNPDF